MSAYVDAEVPFVMIDGKQALTDEQLIESPQLRAFVEQFPRCFERSDLMQCFYYYPEGVTTSGRAAN